MANVHPSAVVEPGAQIAASAQVGPLAAVLPIGGPGNIATLRSDGHLYTTIRYGRRRMPAYKRIPSQDRWDIVNYIRYMNGQKGVQP